MLFIFLNTSVNPWQLKAVVFLYRCLMRDVLFLKSFSDYAPSTTTVSEFTIPLNEEPTHLQGKYPSFSKMLD